MVRSVCFFSMGLIGSSVPLRRSASELSWDCIRKEVGVIVAGEVDDMRYNTKYRIGIDKECVGFPVCLSE